VKQSEWDKISAARKVLQLEEAATLKQIKSAFRRMCKKHHPDLVPQDEQLKEAAGAIQKINEAYEVLLQYCLNYRFPLTPQGSDQPMDAEDWWMERFGQDPLWGKKADSSS
jgi:preprotein translocase subunit Sec63